MRDQARLKLCFIIICGIPSGARPAAMRVAVRTGNVARDDAILAGIKPIPYEDDDNDERRLSTLLWLWTDPEVDWPTFMRCNDETVDIGTQMWRLVSQRYKTRTASEVGDHRQLLHAKNRADENFKIGG
jgi:hypothetical protein